VLLVTATAPSAKTAVPVTYSGESSFRGGDCECATLGFLEFWLGGQSLSTGATFEITYSGEYESE
jgi:hypothetical protein